jgi:hypothetical protein
MRAKPPHGHAVECVRAGLRALRKAIDHDRDAAEQAQQAAPELTFDVLAWRVLRRRHVIHAQDDAVRVHNVANAVIVDASSGAPMPVKTTTDLG